MPFVVVEMWEGRSVSQKRRLARAITDAMVAYAGCGPDHLHVVIHDTPKDSWARAGVLSIDEAPKAKAVPSQPSPKIIGFGHMLLMAADLDAAVDFYVNRLGFTIRPAKPLADGRHFIGFSEGIALVAGRPADAHEVDHIAFEVENVRLLRERLKTAEVFFFNDLHDGPYGLTIYVRDPDGRKIELYEPGENA